MKFLLLSLLLLISALTWAQPTPVLLTENFHSVQLGPYLEYLEETGDPWTVEAVLSPEVASQFQVNSNAFFSKGAFHPAYWFRFTVRNPGPDDQSVIFHIEHEYQFLELYAITPGNPPEPIALKNFLTLLASGASREALLETRLTLPAGQQVEYLMRLNTEFEMKALVSLWEPEARKAQNFFEHGFYLWCWGGLTIFILIYLTIYVALRDPVYFYYAAFLTSFLLFRFHERIWPDLFFVKSAGVYWVVLITLYGALYFGFRFTNSLLHSDQNFPTVHRSVQELMRAVLVGSVILAGVSGKIIWGFALLSLVALVLIPCALWVALKSYVDHREVVIYYLMGWALLLVVALTFPLMTLGVIPYDPTNRIWLEAISLLDAAVFSIALANRFRLIQAEHHRANEEALRSLQEKEQFRSHFLASVSHELRTPLHGMIGLTESALEEARQRCSQQTVEQLNLVVQSGFRLNELVGALLDVSAGKQGELKVHCEAVDLHLLVEEVLEILRADPRNADSQLHNHIPPEFPHVKADHARLEQVFLNLLQNALTHAPQGAIEVRATLQETQVRIEVRDHGPGIPTKDHVRIFKAFERRPTETEAFEQGLGLGLSISSEIIRAHGGSMGVESPPEGGALFWFTLSAEATPFSEEAFANGSSRKPVLERPRLPQLHPSEPMGSILIVDDEVSNLYILLNHLAESKLKVHSCTNGPDALELYQRESLDLILLDVRMPLMDGYEVCEIIRQTASKEELPILFLSALTQSEDVSLGFQAGANDYIFKPFVQSELLARVHSHLELTQLRRQNSQRIEPVHSKQACLSQAMQACLSIWRQEFNKGEIELAQESKLWGVYFDKSNATWKSPTLHRYLSTATLPTKPRWRKVIQTLEFAMQQLPSDHPERARLMFHYAEVQRFFT